MMFQKEGVIMKPTMLNSWFSEDFNDIEFDENVIIAIDHTDGQR